MATPTDDAATSVTLTELSERQRERALIVTRSFVRIWNMTHRLRASPRRRCCRCGQRSAGSVDIAGMD